MQTEDIGRKSWVQGAWSLLSHKLRRWMAWTHFGRLGRRRCCSNGQWSVGCSWGLLQPASLHWCKSALYPHDVIAALKLVWDGPHCLTHTGYRRDLTGEEMSAFFGSLVAAPRNQQQIIQTRMKIQKKGPRENHGTQEVEKILERQANTETMTGELKVLSVDTSLFELSALYLDSIGLRPLLFLLFLPPSFFPLSFH